MELLLARPYPRSFPFWDYLGYEPVTNFRILGRIVPEGHDLGIVYRVETIDGSRVLDATLPWSAIQAHLRPFNHLAPPFLDAAQAVAQAIHQDLQVRLPQLTST